MAEPLGEILASTTTRFSAQAREADAPPAFGSFVCAPTVDGEVLAVVGDTRCGSLDTGRQPLAYGLTAAELAAQQPQLRELLVTEFDALHVGWQGSSPWRPGPPPRPPRLHAFVQPAPSLAVRAVCRDGAWLRTLLAAEATDDLLAAAMAHCLGVWQGDDVGHQATLLGRAAARLFGDDYDRLQALLARLGR